MVGTGAGWGGWGEDSGKGLLLVGGVGEGRGAKLGDLPDPGWRNRCKARSGQTVKEPIRVGGGEGDPSGSACK